jgi:hypothetical protein
MSGRECLAVFRGGGWVLGKAWVELVLRALLCLGMRTGTGEF